MVVGVGAMGEPITRRLDAAGFAVTACDRSETVLERLRADGVATARRITDTHCADVVLVLVASAEQVRDVLTGPDGLLSGDLAGSQPIVAVMSTIATSDLLQLAEATASTGARLVDAPISGGVLRAERGTLAVMAGGEATALESLRPVLAALSTQVIHCGPLGSGMTAKIVNNILGASIPLMLAEACRLAVERGLELETVVEVLEVSTGRNWLTAEPGEARRFYDRLSMDAAGFRAMCKINRKDLSLARDLANTTAGRYPTIEALDDLVRALGDETLDNWRRVGGAGAVLRTGAKGARHHD
jgi:3-hydroxyisobutyrate dehydrogenase-like beta-hydroxyacid dehydrogenase